MAKQSKQILELDVNEQERELLGIATRFVREEIDLYRFSGNGEHIWEAYRIWRGVTRSFRKQPALPMAFVQFFDNCAARLKAAKDPLGIANAVGLGPRKQKGRKGGASSVVRAKSNREKALIVSALDTALWQWNRRIKTPAGDDPIGFVAKKFKKSRGTIDNTARLFGLKKKYGFDKRVPREQGENA